MLAIHELLVLYTAMCLMWLSSSTVSRIPCPGLVPSAEYRREANRAANNGRERKDLYSANWDGDKYKGNGVNVLTVIAAISVLTPLLGLIFAYNTFGVLWG